MSVIVPKIEITIEHESLTTEKLKIIRSNLMTQFENEVPNLSVSLITDSEEKSKLSIRFQNQDSFLTAWILGNIDMTMKIWF